MSKILAISDIHIFDYPQRNYTEKARLYQSRVVTQNIINAGKSSGADILVIAGDVLEKSVVRPYVLAEVKLFLDTLMSNFKEGYIIWGNHDQDNKGTDQDFTDSCLSVMLPPNLHYADKQELIIDNSRIAFYNWRPQFDLSWINGVVDVLFTHATISYGVGDYYKSQVLDDSKFNLAICGDIHKPASIGKYVSIGIPQKCKMSDSDYSTGVIYDCVTKTYEWVNLNPDDNLIKFQYTNDQSSEGWNQSNGTWYVYKPDNLVINNGVRDIKVPAWEKIENLVNSIIIHNNLQNVHGEVLKNLDITSKEVDFNFSLKRFYCKNWRSIDEVELYFDDLDKILISGKNGSGKSSLLSAIRFAFLDCPSIKDFRQFGTKSCLTEVDFEYQGSLYKIQRGNKSDKPVYGLWINGEPQKYNNKTQFVKDVEERFPFIGYINDIYFFDADHHRFIGGMSNEKKLDIISKFYKMDRIDSYNEAAEIILGRMNNASKKWLEKIGENKEILNYLDSKLSLIQLPNIDKETLINDRQIGLDMQKKAKKWSDYIINNNKLEAQIQLFTETLNELIQKRDSLRSIDIINSEYKDLEKKIEECNNKISEVNNINVEYNLKLNSLNQVNSLGNQLYQEWVNLGKSKICSLCGQEIKNNESIEAHKKELENRLRDLSTQQNILTKELSLLENNKKQADSIINNCKEKIREYNKQSGSLISEKQWINSVNDRIINTQSLLDNYKKQLSSMIIPEKVELPDDFMQRMSNIESGINTWNNWESLKNDRLKTEDIINDCNKEIELIKSSTVDLEKYIKLTASTGKIYEEIMEALSKQFSDNYVKYEVVRSTVKYRGKLIDKLDLQPSFFNNGNWVSYVACSSGQQTVVDIDFLSKVVTKMGLLVMDEFLKHLDPMNHDICIEKISSMNIGCIMLSSHMESICSFNNKTCKLELNDSGITKITLE